MSFRHSLLAILAEGPAHGYGLKSSFERSTAGAWPLNIGQVYTTLARLERDGLVAPAAGGAERQTWRITSDGRRELARWFAEPVVEDPPARDELAIKVLLAVAAEDQDVGAILASQRAASIARMQELTRMKAQADPEQELAWTLLLDALVLELEAKVKWVDLCAARLRRRKA